MGGVTSIFARLSRPMPPEDMLGIAGVTTAQKVRPAHDLGEWAVKTFIDHHGILHNEEHLHLLDADIGFLWCSAPNARHMNAIVGEAEIPAFRCGKWQKVRQEQQIEEWFGSIPDFIITIDANYAAQADDVAFCALLEHELYHCGQEHDVYGAPRFSRTTGKPIYGLKGHDVEEFVGVVARYGIGAAAGKTADLVRAANRGPQIGHARIDGACGTCGRQIA